jgi:hypothetical protein
MFESDRQWLLRWNDTDGREQRGDGQQVEQHEQQEREPEALSAPARGIVEDLPISHCRAALIR